MRTDHESLHAFVVQCLQRVNVSEPDALTVADVLVAADLRGVDSHGVARLRRYVDGVRQGKIDAQATTRVLAETPTTAALDGRNGLGQPASSTAIDIAIEKALVAGLSMATVRRSNHFGIAGYYALRAAQKGLFSIVGTNASPQVAPTNGASPMFGTNPIAVAFPTDPQRPFLLDAATSIVPRGKLERLDRDGLSMSPGWAVDPRGQSTTDIPAVVSGLQAREGYALLPLGGFGERYGGHKGYGLATVIELFCGPLAGALWGRQVYGPTGAGLGHFFLCGRVDFFRPIDEFQAESNQMFDELRASPKAQGRDRIMVAGEREYEVEQDRLENGIPLAAAVVDDLLLLAAEIGVSDTAWTEGPPQWRTRPGDHRTTVRDGCS
jgi:LDH2 family malate/lactate/ureidoglycolate dehydrogenase